jgi:hypothetical protein
LLEYLKLIKIAMVHVIGYVEDKKMFQKFEFYQIQTLQPIDNTSNLVV